IGDGLHRGARRVNQRPIASEVGLKLSHRRPRYHGGTLDDRAHGHGRSPSITYLHALPCRGRIPHFSNSRLQVGAVSLAFVSIPYLGFGLGERLTMTTEEALPALLPSPTYTARILLHPAWSCVVKLACPPLSGSAGPIT